MTLWEILVPTVDGKSGKPIRTKHHQEWDKVVRKISGGLTILKPAKGQWIHQEKLYEERMIPVRIAVQKEEDIKKIGEFTLKHYNQLAVFMYKVSDKVIILES